MITLEKLWDEENPDIRIHDGINSFVIARNYLPDPCWYPEIDYYTNDVDISFVIKKEDNEIYTLFDELYQNIKEGNIFTNINDTINKSSKEVKRKGSLYYKGVAQKIGLIQDNKIVIHSEDYDPYDLASVLEIEKANEEFKIVFKKNKINSDFSSMQVPTYNIRIVESYGRYWPYNVIFSKFRTKLQKLNLDDLKNTK